MKLEFVKEDFIGNSFDSNTDCALARACKRVYGHPVSVGSFIRTWTGERAYSGEVIKVFKEPLEYGAPEFEKARKEVAKGTFKPFSVEIEELNYDPE